MSTLLWICQGLLSVVFAFSGLRKGLQSKEEMIASGQTGVRAYRLPFIRFIALAELLGAVGLIVPWATRILPMLTPLAATGLGVIMLGAARAHARLREPRSVMANFILLTLCLLVTVGRISWGG
jgi:hypothetical protein